MIQPERIEDIEFKRTFKGYSPEEVDEFLDALKIDYETLLIENIALKDKLEISMAKANSFESLQESLSNTLLKAEKVAEDTTTTAKYKAKIIIENADLRAREIIEKANYESVQINKEYEETLKDYKIFKSKFKTMLDLQIKEIEDSFKEIESLDKTYRASKENERIANELIKEDNEYKEVSTDNLEYTLVNNSSKMVDSLGMVISSYSEYKSEDNSLG